MREQTVKENLGTTQDEAALLLRGCDTQSVAPHYGKCELILDLILLAFSAWAQFGYSLYSQQNASESLNNPLSKYLYPYINADIADNLFKSINVMMIIFSVADAIFTMCSYINMRRCRQEFIIELRESYDKYKSVKNPLVFIANCILMWSFFIISSFSPWTGFSRGGDEQSSNMTGSSMWIGLMVSYSMSYAPYTFSAPKKIIGCIRH